LKKKKKKTQNKNFGFNIKRRTIKKKRKNPTADGGKEELISYSRCPLSNVNFWGFEINLKRATIERKKKQKKHSSLFLFCFFCFLLGF
jgi:hypothetical protein